MSNFSKKQEQNKPMSDQQFYSLMGIVTMVLATLWLSKNEFRIYAFFYNHAVQIGFLLYALTVAVFVFAAIKLRKKFKLDRALALSKVWSGKDGVYVGKTDDDIRIHLPDYSRTGHVQIIGATGRGKTESVVLPLVMRDLHAKHSTILIDGKGDVELLFKIRKYSNQLYKQVKIISFNLGDLKNSATTNPLAVGSAQQITDRLFAAFDFKEEYYKAVQYEITSTLVELIVEQKIEVSFKLLHELFTSDDVLANMLSKCRDNQVNQRLIIWLNENKDKRDQKTAGIVSQLGVFAKGELACLVNGKVDNRDYFTLSQIVAKEHSEQVALVILLPTLLYQEMAFKLGKMFLQEIASGVALKDNKNFLPVFLDEFSSFVYPGFLGILNKARSSGVALHLSHQSLGDLEIVSAEFAKGVNTNTNVKCLLGLNDPLTADFFAKHLGTLTEQKFTERANAKGIFKYKEMTGEMSVRESEAYKIHPNKLKLFTNGRGVIQFNTPCGKQILEEIQFEALPSLNILSELV